MRQNWQNANFTVRIAFHSLRNGEGSGGEMSSKKEGYALHTPLFWWTIKGSNLGPTGYEPVALTN